VSYEIGITIYFRLIQWSSGRIARFPLLAWSGIGVKESFLRVDITLLQVLCCVWRCLVGQAVDLLFGFVPNVVV